MRLAFLYLLFPLHLFATPQVHDRISVDGDTTVLLSYLKAGPVDTAVLYAATRHLNGSTACWSGYYRRWSVRNDSLFLDGYLACHASGDWFQSAGPVYGQEAGPVFAHWASTDLYAAAGELVTRYDVYLIYEREHRLVVEDGIVRRQSIVSNARTNLVATDSLRNFVYKNLPWGSFPDTNRTAVVGFSIDSLGRPYDLLHLRSNGPRYDSLAATVVRKLPAFSVYYYHGKHLPLRWNFPVSFHYARYRKWLDQRP